MIVVTIVLLTSIVLTTIIIVIDMIMHIIGPEKELNCRRVVPRSYVCYFTFALSRTLCFDSRRGECLIGR